MKKFLLLILFFEMTGNGFAQLSGPELLSTAGDSFKSENFTLSWSLGEVVTETWSQSSFILTQGFQQPGETFIDIQELPGTEKMVIHAFPNPTSGKLTIQFDHSANPSLVPNLLMVFNLQGEVVMQEKLTPTLRQLNLSRLSESSYLLRFINTESQYQQTIIIQKINS